jgi:hypothetical protein
MTIVDGVGLTRGRNCYQLAVPFMVGAPEAFAVQTSIPASVSLPLTLNSAPSNSGLTPR